MKKHYIVTLQNPNGQMVQKNVLAANLKEAQTKAEAACPGAELVSSVTMGDAIDIE